MVGDLHDDGFQEIVFSTAYDKTIGVLYFGGGFTPTIKTFADAELNLSLFSMSSFGTTGDEDLLSKDFVLLRV